LSMRSSADRRKRFVSASFWSSKMMWLRTRSCRWPAALPPPPVRAGQHRRQVLRVVARCVLVTNIPRSWVRKQAFCSVDRCWMRMKLRSDACRNGWPVCWSVLSEKKRSSSANCFRDGGERLVDDDNDADDKVDVDVEVEVECGGESEKREAVMSTVSSALFSYMKPYEASSCELVFSP